MRKYTKQQTTPLSELPGLDSIWEVEHCAKYLGKSLSWVYKRSAQGVLPRIKVGNDNRYEPEAVIRWFKSQAKKR